MTSNKIGCRISDDPKYLNKGGGKVKNLALIAARKSKGLTQEQLAEMLGCKKSSVSNWENGYSNPGLYLAIKTAYILEKDVVELFFNTKGSSNLAKVTTA